MRLRFLALTALAILGAHVARAEISYGTGVPLNRDGWVLTTTDAVSGCAAVETTRGEPAGTILRDTRRGLAAIRFDLDRRPAPIPLEPRAPRRGDRVVAVGYPPDMERDRPFGQTGEVVATSGQRGDPSRLTIRPDRALDAANPSILNGRGHLVALADARVRLDDRRPHAVKTEVISRFLDAEGIRFPTARRSDPALSAQQVYDSTLGVLIQIACLDDRALSGRDRGRPGDDAADAAAFVTGLLDRWSAPNRQALNDLRDSYAATVAYYGRETSARAVLRDKRRFADRWPLRSYAARPDTVLADCFRGFCLVSGEVDFFAYNPDSGDRSRGVARFEYDIDLTTGQIAREAGSVLRGRSGALDAMVAQWRQRNRDCRANRAACGLRDYTEALLRGFDLCVDRAGRGRVSDCQDAPPPAPDPAPAPQPDPVTPADPARETVSSSSEFIRGTTPVSIALFATDLPRDGRVEIFVDGFVRSLDPGTPGKAQFYLKVNGQERALGDPIDLVLMRPTDIALAQTLDIERDGLPPGPVTLEISFRTDRGSIHTAHDTKTQVRVRNDG